MELTTAQRLILLNQYRILAKSDPDEGRADGLACEILKGGYTLEYGSLASHLLPEISRNVCHEVRDILNLYRALKIAARDLPPGFLADADIEFPGFDGNNETEHFAYAKFLRDAQGSGDESKEEPRNSHRPMLMRYRWMLRIWRQCADQWCLTPEDVALILSRK